MKTENIKRKIIIMPKASKWLKLTKIKMKTKNKTKNYYQNITKSNKNDINAQQH